MELLRLIVQFTPTEKDDQLLNSVETFLKDNPALAPVLIELFFKLLRHK